MNINKQRAALAIGTCGLLAAAGCGATKTVTNTVAGPTVAGPTVTQTVTAGPTKIVTKVKDVPGPTIIKTTIKDVPTPQPTEGVLMDASGTGTSTTKSFTVGGSGDYVVYWTFSNNDSQGDGGDNYIVSESTAGSGQDSDALSLPNVIQTSGSGNTEVDGDPGSHVFSVQADPTCSWTIKVVSAP
jgi:hypothetical protein